MKYRKGPLSIRGGGGGGRDATRTNMMRMLNPISACDWMAVTRVSLTFTTLQGGTECGNEPLSPFLNGRMFLREPSWKYSAKLVLNWANFSSRT